MSYGDAYPNSRSYGTSYEYDQVSGPAIGLGFQLDLSNGETAGAQPILSGQLQFARRSKSQTSEELGGLTIEKNFLLNALSGLVHAGVSFPIGKNGLKADIGGAANIFLTFNEERKATRITSNQVNTISYDFSEGGTVGLGPFAGLSLQSGRYGYGLRSTYLLRPVSKRTGYYPRSFSLVQVEFVVSYQLKG